MRRSNLRPALAALFCAAASALPGTDLHGQTMDPLRNRIAAVAAAEGFDPATALAIVSIESAFDTAAIGKGGPLGLMQIKLGSAALVIPGVTRSDLFNPETNVRAGLRYLQTLMDEFGGDLETAVRAYKNGPRAIAAGKAPTPATISYMERFHRAQTRYAGIIATDSAARAMTKPDGKK